MRFNFLWFYYKTKDKGEKEKSVREEKGRGDEGRKQKRMGWGQEKKNE